MALVFSTVLILQENPKLSKRFCIVYWIEKAFVFVGKFSTLYIAASGLVGAVKRLSVLPPFVETSVNNYSSTQ